MRKHVYRLGYGLALSKTKDIERFEQIALRGYKPISLNLWAFTNMQPLRKTGTACSEGKVTYVCKLSICH